MRPSEIIKRITGFSTPFGGVSWTAPEAEVAIARRVIRFLEDRRVLYNPSQLEVPRHCVESVIEIRHFLTLELGQLSTGELVASLAAMRAACRKFLDGLQWPDGRPLHLPMGMRSGFEEWVFVSALGELRGVVGVLVGELAVTYDIDVDGTLVTILPADPHAEADDSEELSGFDL